MSHSKFSFTSLMEKQNEGERLLQNVVGHDLQGLSEEKQAAH